jgi:hypothetical protein
MHLKFDKGDELDWSLEIVKDEDEMVSVVWDVTSGKKW